MQIHVPCLGVEILLRQPGQLCISYACQGPSPKKNNFSEQNKLSVTIKVCPRSLYTYTTYSILFQITVAEQHCMNNRILTAQSCHIVLTLAVLNF